MSQEQNNGTCADGVNSFTCNCADGLDYMIMILILSVNFTILLLTLPKSNRNSWHKLIILFQSLHVIHSVWCILTPEEGWYAVMC